MVVSVNGVVEIVEMDWMCKLIVDYMVMLKYIFFYVIFFVEVDVMNIVNWRNKIKGDF